ncbi:MAG: ABC transporter ATP-binding protein [Verrucomicrobiota bacterium]|nr:ABC transporter ATP-binding protein [Verrucomicrobiota bacterium]
MNKTVIKVENLGKCYKLGLTHDDLFANKIVNGVKRIFGKAQSKENEDFWALKDVSFEVKQGDVVGIIGRNGAGKSTLLKILSRITKPTTGNIQIKGRVASLLEVGTGFHPELTGRENVFLNGAILGMKKAEIKKKFDEIVVFAEVEKFIDTPVKRYSSGMYVRLAFAVAAHLEPEILIVDEVLAVGDIQFQKKCLGKMKNIAGEGRTVLFVSHNMDAIQNLCNTALVLFDGQSFELESPIDAIKKHLTSNEEKKPVKYISRPNDTPIYFSKILLLNLASILTTEFIIFEKWKLKAIINVEKEIKNICVGLSISQNNILIQVVWSKPHLYKEGQYSIIFTNDNTDLLPGNFDITVSLRIGVKHRLHHVDNAISFKIVKPNKLKLQTIPEYGFLLNDFNIKIKKMNNEE